MNGAVFDLLPLARIDGSHDARRCTEYETPRWDNGSRGDQRTCTHEAAAANTRSVEDRRTHSDQTVIFDHAAVDDCTVADRAVITDHGCELPRGHVRDRAVLQVGARADPDRVGITAHHRRVPDRRLVADHNITDHRTGLGQEHPASELRTLAIERQDNRGHATWNGATPVRRPRTTRRSTVGGPRPAGPGRKS